jgi:hypothetical protein
MNAQHGARGPQKIMMDALTFHLPDFSPALFEGVNVRRSRFGAKC